MRIIENNRAVCFLQKVLSLAVVSMLTLGIVLAGEHAVAVTSDGLVSMSGENIAVEDIMTSLGIELNVKVSFPTPISDKVSVDFQDLKLRQAINQVTQSYIIVTEMSAGKNGIKEIIVMPEGEASAYLPVEGGYQTNHLKILDKLGASLNQLTRDDPLLKKKEE